MSSCLGAPSIPVVLVEDGMRVEKNRIYLIPPKKEMIVSGGKLLLSDKGASQGLMLPIDLFFRSLAEDMGERAIGIVLSGAGSDGARGIRDIHEGGGLVLCQDERSAYFDGMPRSARETGVVDFVLPPAQMPSALLEHARDPDEQRRVQELEHSPTRPYGVTAALRFLQNAYGIDFTHYKPIDGRPAHRAAFAAHAIGLARGATSRSSPTTRPSSMTYFTIC